MQNLKEYIIEKTTGKQIFVKIDGKRHDKIKTEIIV